MVETLHYSHLIGIPPFGDFLQFLRNRSSPGEVGSDATLVREWRAASARIQQMQEEEGAWSTSARVAPLPEEVECLARLHTQDPEVQHALGALPFRWALVDLAQLIVDQRSIDLSYVEQLGASLPRSAPDEQIFRFAAGHTPPPPDVQVTRLSDGMYAFTSVSSDLRLLEIALVDSRSQRLAGVPSAGFPTHWLTLAIGFSVNCICALRIQERLILINGTHRAGALHQQGLTQIPCLIRDVGNEDDLDLIGLSSLKPPIRHYLQCRRPPLIRDFWDPQLRKLIQAAPARRLLHIQVHTQRSRVSIA